MVQSFSLSQLEVKPSPVCFSVLAFFNPFVRGFPRGPAQTDPEQMTTERELIANANPNAISACFSRNGTRAIV